MDGARDRIRTGDLFVTNEVLYRLSYTGMVGMLGLEPRNPEGADLQSAAVAAVPHPHSVFKHRTGRTPCSGVNNTTWKKSCQRVPRYRAYLPHEYRTIPTGPQVAAAVPGGIGTQFASQDHRSRKRSRTVYKKDSAEGVCLRPEGSWSR